MKKYSRGFTLIELLVVISIISMLSSVVLASVASARVRARDSVRLQQIHQLDLAVQLYVADTGTAPLSDTCSSSTDLDSSTVYNCIAKSNPPAGDGYDAELQAWTTLKTELTKYVPGLKKDSCGSSCSNDSGYIYVAPAAVKYVCTTGSCDPATVNATSYQVYARLEKDGIPVGYTYAPELDSFYDPAYPNDDGGYGDGGDGGEGYGGY